MRTWRASIFDVRFAALLHTVAGVANLWWGGWLLRVAWGWEEPLADVMVVFGTLYLLHALLFVAVAASLLLGYRWSRTFTRLIWLPQLLNVPIGTAIALYVVFALEHGDEREDEPGA